MKKGYKLFNLDYNNCKLILVCNYDISNNIYNKGFDNYKELEDHLKIAPEVNNQVNIGVWKIKN